MKFEIDVSGNDLFTDSKYTICIASKDKPDGKNIIKGYRIDPEVKKTLIEKWKNNEYRYHYDRKEKRII